MVCALPALASLHFYLLAAPSNPLPASHYYSNALPESLYLVYSTKCFEVAHHISLLRDSTSLKSPSQ